MEGFQDLVFMIFGLGFFVFCISYANRSINNDNERDYNRRLNEAREFGIYENLERDKKRTGFLRK